MRQYHAHDCSNIGELLPFWGMFSLATPGDEETKGINTQYIMFTFNQFPHKDPFYNLLSYI